MTILALIPNWLKFATGGLVALVLVAGGSYFIGKREGCSQTEIEAAKNALDRINTLEKTMRLSAISRIIIAALSLCAIAGCQNRPAINGSGYQFVRFSDPQAARLASQDATAGPAINSNNRQCAADAACRK